MASFQPPKKNTAFEFYVGLVSQVNPKILQVSPTLAAGDVKVSIDNASPNNITTLPVIGGNTRQVKVNLSSAEMNGDNITVVFSDAAGAEWCDLIVNIQTSAQQIDDLSTLTAAGVRTAVGLGSANLDTQLSGIQSDTDNLQTRIPAALVSGRIDASVGAMASGVLTATAIAADAITAAKIADGAIDAATFAAGAIDAAAIAADAIGSSELAASAVTEIQTGLATAAALATVQADTDDIQTRLPAALVSGRIDASVGAMAANVLTATAIAADAITAGKIAADAIGASELAADAVAEIQSGLSTLDASGVRSAVGIASANLDTQLAAIAALWTTQLTESYNADGVAPTPAQALFVVMQRLTEISISGLTMTVKKLDGSTTAFTLTLDSASAPTSSTRAT